MADCAYIGCDRQVAQEGDTCDWDCYQNWHSYWEAGGYDLTKLPDDVTIPKTLRTQPWWEAELRRYELGRT